MPIIETGITKNQILAELVRSPHGDLKAYVPIGIRAAEAEGEFFSHLISYNFLHGQIRDSKVALPVVSLSTPKFNIPELVENSLAHLAVLDPRNLVRAYRFAKEIKTPGHMSAIRRMVERYLRYRENNWAYFTKQAIQHRKSLQELYALAHVARPRSVGAVLFGQEGSKRSGKAIELNPYPTGSVFAEIARLKDMSPAEAAGFILGKRIPFLVAMGAVGAKIKETDIAMALIDRASASELVTNTKLFQALGVKTNPVLKAAYEKALAKASGSKKTTLKATAAVEAIDDEGLKEKLRSLQEKQIKATGGISGRWLVCVDKSGSMQNCVEVGKHVASTITKFVQDSVYMIFFDTTPRYFDVTGMGLDQIQKQTKHVVADGGTSIGCAMRYAIDAKLDVDGIVVVSDGGENTAPYFHLEYAKYVAQMGKEPTVYFLYLRGGEADRFSGFCEAANIDLQKIDLPDTVDYYSLPNLISGLRVSRYSKIDEILGQKLLTLDDVFG
jgi:hypothetical protein